MKTIEEIALENSIKYLGRISPAYECGFMQGVSFQKSIDDEEYRKDMRYVNIKKQEWIDKACKWWTDYLEYPTHTQEDRDRIKEMVDEFRKAIEN